MNNAEFSLHLVCSVLILSSLVAFSFDQLWVGFGILINVVAIEMAILRFRCWPPFRRGRAHYLPRNPEQAIAARVVAADGRSWLIHPPDSADERSSAIHPPVSVDERSRLSYPPVSADGTDIPGKTTVMA